MLVDRDTIPMVEWAGIMDHTKDLVTKCVMAAQDPNPQTVEIVYTMPIITFSVFVLAIATTMVIRVTSFSSALYLKSNAIPDAAVASVWILRIA